MFSWLGRWLCSIDCHRWFKLFTSRICRRCHCTEYMRYDYETGIPYWWRKR